MLWAVCGSHVEYGNYILMLKLQDDGIFHSSGESSKKYGDSLTPSKTIDIIGEAIKFRRYVGGTKREGGKQEKLGEKYDERDL